MQDFWFEYIGYIASGFVIISFLLGNNVAKIRLFNMVGCSFFVIYGILIESTPVILTNVFITLIQVYYLYIK